MFVAFFWLAIARGHSFLTFLVVLEYSQVRNSVTMNKVELDNLVIIQDVSLWIRLLVDFLSKEILKELLVVSTGRIDCLQDMSVFVC